MAFRRKLIPTALALVAVIALGAWLLQGIPGWMASTVSQVGAASGATPKTIADFALGYTGELSRALFPETSLGLPLALQAGISIGIVLLTILTYAFFPQARRWVMLLTTVTILRHLFWRGFETLDTNNPLATTVGIIIYAAELMAFVSLVLGYFQTWGQTHHEAVPVDGVSPEQLPTVDVMVCTYNEPVSVLYRTLVGCQSIDYPKKQVFLCDDGRRPEMQELAQRLGVHYVTRSDNAHAKAGNLNNALRGSQGDLVVVFDADHVPCKQFLWETIGFFLRDPGLGFIQTPQHFFTPDPFQRNLVTENTINNEQDLFFHVIQPGNDYWGAAFFAGSGALFRRHALAEIGGFATETITEDTHTGLRLHTRGWRSLYYNRDLSAGLAQDSFADFVKQRLRWGRGMTQILFYDNPLLVRGLSFGQRLCYFAGIWYFFHGLPRVIFMLAPLAFLLFGIKTVNAGFFEVLVYYLPSFLALTLGYSIVSRGVRHSFWSEVYEVATCIYLTLTAVATCLSPGRSKFRVTPKGGLSDRHRFDLMTVLPQVVVAWLTLVGVFMAIIRTLYTPDYVGGIYTNVFWACYNLVLLGGAIYVAQERPQFRLAPRIEKRIRVEARLLDGSIAVGNTTNISESGLSVVFDEPIPVSGTMTLKILDWDINESSVIQAQAVRSAVDSQNRHTVGFRLVNRSEEQHQAMVRHMFGNPEVWNHEHFYRRTGASFWELMTTPLRLAGTREQAIKRRSARFQATFNCLIELEGQGVPAFSNEVSETGLSLFVRATPDLAQRLQQGAVIPVRIQWPNERVSAMTAQVVRAESAQGGHLKLGLNFVNLTREQRLDLIQQIYRPREGVIRVAPSVNSILPCRLTLPNGQAIHGYTEELSEMGAVVSLQDRPSIQEETPVAMDIQWEDGAIQRLAGLIKGIQQPAPNQRPVALVYFDRLDLKTIDLLSARIHEPLEARSFTALNVEE